MEARKQRAFCLLCNADFVTIAEPSDVPVPGFCAEHAHSPAATVLRGTVDQIIGTYSRSPIDKDRPD